MNILPLAFVDTETTGTNPKRDRVIEIGVIKVEKGEIVDKLDTVVQPHSLVPPEIYSLTGIKADAIARAPDFEELKSELKCILEDAIFVAHNARFDYAFLKHEFGRHGEDFQAKVLCTIKLTRRLFPKLSHYSLEHLINYFGLKPKYRHRAYADAQMLWELYKISLENHGEEIVSAAISSILKTSSLPSNLDKKMVENLPESPGIYFFYRENSSLPLYVGKSINIRDRVKGHFSADHANASDLTMSSQIVKVEAMETAGELGALIREADAIKALMPVYNKKLRRRRDLIVALASNLDGYSSVGLENLEEVKDVNTKNIMAIFRSIKTAKENLYSLAKDYNLCPKLLGLEKTGGSCFSSQIGICNGACTKDELPEIYNKRFKEAFAHTKVRKWPFKKPVVIKEENINGLTELHFVDNWKYLGSAVYSVKLQEHKIEKYTPRFDWDIYKILAKAVLSGKNIHQITEEERAFWEQAGQAL